MNRVLPACAFLAVLALTSVVSCSREQPGEAATDAAPAERVLRRGNGGDPSSLDPSKAEDDHAFRVLTDLYEGLVITDAAGGIATGVATDWTISDDGITYTFTLRPDATWSNGERVTAQHFVDSFRRTLAPGTGSVYSFLLLPVRNATAVQQGERPPSALGVAAPDDETLVIELESPAAHFLSVLAMPIAFPLTPAVTTPGHRFSDPAQFVGNGPYVLQEWQPGHRIRLEKNPQFWDAQAVMIDAIEYYAVGDLQTEFNMYRSGELDITVSVPGPHVRDLLESRPSEIRIAPKLGLYYLAFDLSEAPFDDPDLRRALSLAIDRQALVEVIGRGEQPAYGLVPDGIPGYEPWRYAWSTASDEERIAEARLAFESSRFSTQPQQGIKLTYDVGDIHEKVAVAVSGMWRDVLGIEVTLDKREWQYFLDTRDRRDQWQIMRFAWIGDFNHPSTFTDLFRSDNPQNLPGYANPRYDTLLDAVADDPDLAMQAAQLASAEETLLRDYAIAPLYFYVSKHLVSPAVDGFEHNALDRHPSRFLRLSRQTTAN